jgi:hypothetical protein
MGYRTYIGYLPKEKYQEIKDLPKTELLSKFGEDEDGYVGPYEIGKELYEFGKYTNFNPPDGSMFPFFSNRELQEFYSEDNELWVVNKDFLKYIIETYKEKIRGYLGDMVKPFLDEDGYRGDFLKSVKTNYGIKEDKYEFDGSVLNKDQQNSIVNILNHIISINSEWNMLAPFNLDDGKDEVTSSWKYEYSIFELVRIYKSFDWENNVMIHYGY